MTAAEVGLMVWIGVCTVVLAASLSGFMDVLDAKLNRIIALLERERKQDPEEE